MLEKVRGKGRTLKRHSGEFMKQIDTMRFENAGPLQKGPREDQL